jgi:hypothetical protein
MTTRVVFALIISIVSLLPIPASRAQEEFPAYGAGLQSCGTWTAERNDDFRRQRQSWVFGFVSAYDFYCPAGSQIKPADNNAITAWVDSYCAAHPLDLIVYAAVKLVDEMRQAKGLPAVVPGLGKLC